ncbi:MAG: hypothetical protein J1E35_08230 [Lachnospiraceae bacterium]|nr:hypothetical protein [Lachnospiraceae bacterium]
MSKKAVILAISGVFYLAMLLLAVFAKKVHMASLPHVRIGYLERRVFLLEDKREYMVALPEELYGKTLYRLSEEEKNGEIRFVARRIGVSLFEEKQGGYYPVRDGLNGFTTLIVEGFEGLEDGWEVYVENEEEIR